MDVHKNRKQTNCDIYREILNMKNNVHDLTS